MTSFIIRQITNRIFHESSNNSENDDITQYHLFEQNKLITSITKPPPTQFSISSNLSTKNHRIIKKFKRRAYQLDNLFSLFGFQLGLNSLIGLIPFVGSFLNLLNSLLIYLLVFELDKPLPLLLHVRLWLNIWIEFVSNFIPILGQLFNASYKANTRNAHLVVNFLNNLSDANYNSLLKYVNTDNKNNVNNSVFEDEDDVSTTASPQKTYHYLTKDDDFDLLDDSSSHTSTYRRPKVDLQDKLNAHQRKLSNHVYESDVSTSSFFK